MGYDTPLHVLVKKEIKEAVGPLEFGCTINITIIIIHFKHSSLEPQVFFLKLGSLPLPYQQAKTCVFLPLLKFNSTHSSITFSAIWTLNLDLDFRLKHTNFVVI
jgi:hypothetical protein